MLLYTRLYEVYVHDADQPDRRLLVGRFKAVNEEMAIKRAQKDFPGLSKWESGKLSIRARGSI
jgi:1,2-phenylacetyl-CoA epoxidase PaaB subunit